MKHTGHPHRHDSVNFPDMEYKNVFGGTMGEKAAEERDHHNLGLFNGKSAAMFEHKSGDSLVGFSTKFSVALWHYGGVAGSPERESSELPR